MKHGLIRGVLGSDQYIPIDGRFGSMRIIETVRQAVRERLKVLPRLDTYIVDVYHGPRVGQGKCCTVCCGSPESQQMAIRGHRLSDLGNLMQQVGE